MIPAAYRALLRRQDVRRLLLVAMVARIPHTAAALVLTLHIVQELGRTYGEAGLIVAVFTIGIGIGAPWRGRLVDRVGLRRALIPSIIGEAITWPLAGFVPYWALFPVVFFSGLFALPIFSVVRKALSVAVDAAQRRTAFAMDSVGTEIMFMAGPAAGIWCAEQFGPPPVLVFVGVATAAAGVLLIWYNPPMTTRLSDVNTEQSAVLDAIAGEPSSLADSDSPVPDDEHGARVVPPTRAEGVPARQRPTSRLGWVTGPVLVILAMSTAASVALSGTDVGVLALMREHDAVHLLGFIYAVWCFGSAVGGLLYGAWHKELNPVWLVLTLGLCTIPLAFVTTIWALALLLVVAGFACAPVVVATGDRLTHLVPEERRGEALGWQGTAFTLGTSVGSPLAGVAIDRYGPSGGFLTVAALALLVAAIGGSVDLRAWRKLPRRE